MVRYFGQHRGAGEGGSTLLEGIDGVNLASDCRRHADAMDVEDKERRAGFCFARDVADVGRGMAGGAGRALEDEDVGGKADESRPMRRPMTIRGNFILRVYVSRCRRRRDSAAPSSRKLYPGASRSLSYRENPVPTRPDSSARAQSGRTRDGRRDRRHEVIAAPAPYRSQVRLSVHPSGEGCLLRRARRYSRTIQRCRPG